MRWIILFLTYFGISESRLWPKGVVHYAINPKDYDVHSQDEITATFAALEKEICVKFFTTPFNSNTSERILYIANPNKDKNCPPRYYNYTGNIVNMPIGYKCINKNDIARMAIEMLKASIDPSAAPINSFDLVKRFEEQDQTKPRPTFLTTEDRDYINAHYHGECSTLAQRAYAPASRRSGDSPRHSLSADNLSWYRKRVWPLGVVMYWIDRDLHGTEAYVALKYAMTTIELNSCIVFQAITKNETISPKSMLVFKLEGEEDPWLGFKEGIQTLSLHSVAIGDDAGHTAHALNNLMRVLGVPMMSNRYDRDNYVDITWKHVKKGKELLLEKSPKQAWVMGIPYDFDSATHAPANYMCHNCPPGGSTVQPLQDYLWRRRTTMGHTKKLSESDEILLDLVYDAQCKMRNAGLNKF